MQSKRLDDFIARFELATMNVGRSIGHCAAGAGGEMTGPQHHVMRLLIASGGMKSSDLAEALGTQPSAVTAAVDRLEARGFVTRERDDSDRRVVRVVPSELGASEYRRVEALIRAHVRQMLSVLDDAELEALVTAFEKMSRALQSPATSA
ncbi:MAG: MarR family transcriptional regulator [Coriobacteriia bacterium]|nr:MarR family transcriptional regulator [Coriobacteriia bacterium]